MSDLRVLDRAGATGNLLEKLPVPRSDADPKALPMSAEEMRQRGWDSADVVFVTGDAYIDHPSFAMAILGRILEAAGFRVGIVSQPDWQSADDWRRFGKPRLFYAISAGNMDSMINHYTANRKVRNNDAYSPGGRGDLIGGGGDALIPATPPREAIALRRKDASERFSGQYVHTVPAVEKKKRTKKQSRNEAGTGYRPKHE